MSRSTGRHDYIDPGFGEIIEKGEWAWGARYTPGQGHTRCSFCEAKMRQSKYPVCKPCVRKYPIVTTAAGYNVPWERVLTWIDDPMCEMCGATFEAIAWNIDHDHSCCPTTPACGRCVRGLLCRRCNLGLWGIESLSADLGLEEAIRRVSDYLRRNDVKGILARREDIC